MTSIGGSGIFVLVSLVALPDLRHGIRSMGDLNEAPFIPPGPDEDIHFIDDQQEEEATMSLLSIPPRKRARCENEHDSQVAYRSSSEVARDDEFYMSDGSCIILVENTLFNVSHNSSASSQYKIIVNERYIGQSSPKTHRRSALCSHYHKAIIWPRVCQMAIPSS